MIERNGNMTVDQLIGKVHKRLNGKDFQDRELAIQVNLTGKIGGVFYIEIRNGEVSVMPYEYIDNDAIVSATMTNFDKLVTGRLDLMTVVDAGKIKVEGNLDKVVLLTELMK